MKMRAKAFCGFVPELIVFDFDGVFTDNAVYVDENGVESVRCHRGDGLGIDMLRKSGYLMLILSTETNPVVAARGRKLQIPVVQGCSNKREYLEEYIKAGNIDSSRIIYIGDDVNDLDAMKIAGLKVCPANAHPTIKEIADIVLFASGGHGAVREFCERLFG